MRCELPAAPELFLRKRHWRSQQQDDLVIDERLGVPTEAGELGDMTALNWMPRVPLQVTAQRTSAAGQNGVTIRLQNPTRRIAFERAEIMTAPDGTKSCPRIQRQLRHGVRRNRRAARRLAPTDRTVAN